MLTVVTMALRHLPEPRVEVAADGRNAGCMVRYPQLNRLVSSCPLTGVPNLAVERRGYFLVETSSTTVLVAERYIRNAPTDPKPIVLDGSRFVCSGPRFVAIMITTVSVNYKWVRQEQQIRGKFGRTAGHQCINEYPSVAKASSVTVMGSATRFKL